MPVTIVTVNGGQGVLDRKRTFVRITVR